ncbi:MAG: hypothetical protein ABSE27_11375 [Acidobacteriaceae bacterium]|jgi:hypothetical protein
MAERPELRTWLNWSMVVNTPPLTKELYRFALQTFPRANLLISCARLSSVLKLGAEGKTVASDELTARYIQKLFDPATAERVKHFADKGQVIFFQGQLRYLAAEVMRLEPKIPDEAFVEDANIGKLLLGAAELMHFQHIDMSEELDSIARVVAEFLPVSEVDSLNDAFSLFLRFYICLRMMIPRLPAHKRLFDVDVEFEQAFGFPLKLYYLFVYTCIMHARLDREDKPAEAGPGGSFGKEWFKSTDLTDEQLEKLFRSVSCSLDDLPDRKTPHGYADFDYLRDHPYFRYNEQLYCLDYEYAVSKVESGVIWRVRDNLPKNKREAYFSFWGYVFEEYVAWLFEAYADKRTNEFYRSPRYEDKQNEEICDAIVICGKVAVLVEDKQAICSSEVRYSGSHEKVRKFLEDRLVSPKGVKQLATAIENITSVPKERLPRYLRGIKKYVPLIITKDDAGSGWMVNRYLNARFNEEFKRRKHKRFKITPLVSMSVGTLERAISALSRMALSDILEDRIRSDSSLSIPFEAASSLVPRGTPRNMDKHLEIMHRITREMQAEFKLRDSPASA